MAEFITPAISAGQLVTVTSNVLPAGGNALNLIETMLTQNWRVPIGSVYQFASPTDVAAFFGQNTTQAGLASVYFNGFNNSNVKPGLLNFWRHATTAVGAYLRGGNVSGLSLTQLQALNGTLSVTIDAVLKSGDVDLSTATSFSSAAQIIQDTLGIEGEAAASFTASIGATFTGTASGTNLTVTSVAGVITPGSAATATISGTGITSGTYIVSQTSGTTGGAGVYVTSQPSTASGTSITMTSTQMTVTGTPTGTLAVGQLVSGAGVTADSFISGMASDTSGAAGTYTLTNSMQVESESMTSAWPAVAYDSVFGAFIIHSGTTGANSTITFAATDAFASSLKLTQATGAVLSQGTAAYTPASSMNAITAITQNWVTFQTDWEPSDSDKEGFAAWASGQNGGTLNRYGYIMWDTNVLDTEQGGPSPPAAYINAGQLSGTVMIYQNPDITTLPGEKAAFFAGMVASVDYTETNGDVTFAGKGQSGLLPDITDGNVAVILAGNPQVQGSFGYGINFYGDYTTANQAFIQWQRGLVSGPFTWADDYFNQIWFNNQCQLALMLLTTTAKSLPYAPPGYAMVEAVLLDPISQALNFGMIVPGVTLSNAQIAQINSAAGNTNAATAVANQGYYLQVKPAIAQVRQSRTSPPCTIFYSTGESIQSINLASVQVQ